MIIGEWKPVPELIAKLSNHNKVLLVGCGTCMAECASGGEREVDTLAPLLRIALAEAGNPTDVKPLVLERQCEFEFVETLSELTDGVDAIMSLACGVGVQAVAERFPGIPVYPAINTTALAVRQEAGVWAARCAACGDCVLGETYGFCPVARCAKSLFNGPCGGTRDDAKCEVDESIDCVWCLIYERAQERGSVETLLTVRKPKSWSNSRHGGPKKMVREDLRI